MRTLLLAAAALSSGMASAAYADGGDTPATTRFTSSPTSSRIRRSSLRPSAVWRQTSLGPSRRAIPCTARHSAPGCSHRG